MKQLIIVPTVGAGLWALVTYYAMSNGVPFLSAFVIANLVVSTWFLLVGLCNLIRIAYNLSRLNDQ